MDFLQLAQERRSIRNYQDKPVDDNALLRILEAGRIAPTAANKQPQRFLVIRSPERLAKLGKAANLHGAPLAIVVCCRKDAVWVRPQDGHPMTDIDSTIAATHMMLEGWAAGLGSCWITWFDPALVRAEFSLPSTVEPVNILVFGYAESTAPSMPQRMPLESMVWMETAPQ